MGVSLVSVHFPLFVALYIFLLLYARSRAVYLTVKITNSKLNVYSLQQAAESNNLVDCVWGSCSSSSGIRTDGSH